VYIQADQDYERPEKIEWNTDFGWNVSLSEVNIQTKHDKGDSDYRTYYRRSASGHG